MANASLIVAGSRITAALLQSVAPLAVIKGADETVTNSTALQNDNELFVTCAANATYVFDCYLDFEGAAVTTGDIQWQWSTPSGATLRYQPIYAVVGSGLAISAGTTVTGATTVSAGTNGSGSLRGASMNGTLVMGSTAGNLQLKWAQNTANNSTGTTVHAQSYLALWRVT